MAITLYNWKMSKKGVQNEMNKKNIYISIVYNDFLITRYNFLARTW
jgi:hypothetical protein